MKKAISFSSKTLRLLFSFLFRNTSTHQTIVKNTFWLLGGSIISRLVRASFIIYAARVLGTMEYGVFSYALGLAAFFSVFNDLSLTAIMVREAAKDRVKMSQYFSTTFFLKSILLIVTALIIVFIAPHFSKIEAAQTLIPLIALLVIFDSLRDFGTSYFRAQERMEVEAIIQFITNLVIAATGFAILRVTQDSYGLTMAYVFSVAVGAVIVFAILRNEFRNIAKNFTRSLVRPLIKSAMSIGIVNIFGPLMLSIDTVMLGFFRGAEEVGIYAASQRIVQLLYILPVALTSGVFPTLSRLLGEQKLEQLRSVAETALHSLTVFSLPIIVGGYILAVPIMNLVFGTLYAGGAFSFSILNASIVFAFPAILIGNIIFVFDKQKEMVRNFFIAGVLNLVLNAILIPKFGGVGSAIAILLSQTAYYYANRQVMTSLLRINPFRFAFKSYISTIIMGGVAYLMNYLGMNVIVIIVVSGILYALLLLVLRDPITTEILRLRRRLPSVQ